MVKHAEGARNIFNITDPQRYRCQVLHYHARLSRLYLSVYKDQMSEPVFYLLFSDVGYLQCPMTWQGAAFDIGMRDACLQLMLDHGLIGAAVLRFPQAYAALTEAVRLYIAHTAHEPAQIIAGSASMLHQLPKDLA
jgi:hypothetical protein